MALMNSKIQSNATLIPSLPIPDPTIRQSSKAIVANELEIRDQREYFETPCHEGHWLIQSILS